MDKNDKKQQILQAARSIMAVKGYEKASIKEIANKAEVAPGLVHYYFKNKEEILTVLLMEASNQYTIDMQHLRSTTAQDHLSEAALQHTKQKVELEPGWYRLRYELFALGLRNETLTEGVKELIDKGQKGISKTLAPMLGKNSEELETLASILLACFDGLALQKLLDQDKDLEAAYRLLEKMVLSTIRETH